MANFLRKLMFWRTSTGGETSGPSPTEQEELDYEAQRREEYIQERRDEDEFQLGGRSREDEYRQAQDDIAP